VQVSEAMVSPEASAPNGQWVELANLTGRVVDLSGLTLSTSTTPTSWTIPDGTTLAPHGFLVVGQSTNSNDNDQAGVQLAWTGLTPGSQAADSLVLAATTPLSTLSWTASALKPGNSVQPPETAIDTKGIVVSCARAKTFGQNGAIGTPGAVNESCSGYQMLSIPSAFEDISSSGTAVFVPGTITDAVASNLDLSSASFPYFGASRSAWTISPNGWLAPGFGWGSGKVAKTVPGAAFPGLTAPPPIGAIAVFWTDVKVTNSTANVFYQRRTSSRGRPAYWVIQWSHFSYVTASPADDLNFEAKLFDDGVIEFHYATMKSGTTGNFGTGMRSTTWIESTSADRALPVGINSAYLTPYMTSNLAIRYTPTTPVTP
jgi:hypothetical protein